MIGRTGRVTGRVAPGAVGEVILQIRGGSEAFYAYASARGAASSLSNIDNLVVLNGAEGMEDLLAKAMTKGGAGLGLAQQLMTSIKGDKPAGVALPVVPTNGKVDSLKV